jgi:hypothetical protein
MQNIRATATNPNPMSSTSRPVAIGVAIALLLSPFVAARPANATPAEDAAAAAVAEGRAMGRALVIFHDPETCAPLLRIAVCKSDLDTFFRGTDRAARLARVPHAKPNPAQTLDAYITDGDPRDADPALAWLSATEAPANDLPRVAQFEDDGIAASMIDAAAGDRHERLVAGAVLVDLAHRRTADDAQLMTAADRAFLTSLAPNGEANAYGANLTAAKLPMLDTAETAFARAVDRAYPADPSPALAYDDTPEADIRLGMAVATVREYLAFPHLASLPESRAFAALTLKSVADAVPATANDGDAVLAAMGTTSERTRANAAKRFGTLAQTFFGEAPLGSIPLLLLGNTVAELAYDAATTRSATNAATYDAALAQVVTLPNISADVAARVKAIRACGKADFACRRRAAYAFAAALR